MEGQSNQEVQAKTAVRAEQREKVWGRISDPLVKQRLEQIISGGLRDSRMAIGMLARSLGKQTYPVFFDLASTSRSTEELAGTFSAIGYLNHIDWTDKVESRKALLEQLSGTVFTRTSQEAQKVARTLLERKSIGPFLRADTRGREIFKQYMVEAVFIALSSPSQPQSTKESILNSLSFLMTNREAFDQNTSFWRYTDGSWTNPNLKSASSAKDENPPSARKTNEGFKGGRGGKEEKRTIFDILGLPSTATPTEVRSTYRKHLLEIHPDSVKGKLDKEGTIGSQDAEEKMRVANQMTKELHEAYKAYDESQKSQTA